MKKKIKVFITIIVAIILMILFTLQVDSKAASFRSSISKTSATVGDTITITIQADNAAGMYNVNISGSAVALTSGASSEWIENESITLQLEASQPGTATITVSTNNMADLDNSENKLNEERTYTVTVKEKETSDGGNTSGGNTSSGENSESGSSSGGNNSSSGNENSENNSSSTPTFREVNETV